MNNRNNIFINEKELLYVAGSFICTRQVYSTNVHLQQPITYTVEELV